MATVTNRLSNNRLGRIRIPVLTWGTAYFLLWCYRTAFSILGEVLVARLTSIADTKGYQQKHFLTALEGLDILAAPSGSFFLQAVATTLTDITGGFFNLLTFGSPVMVNIGFQTIGFVGLVAFLRSIESRERAILLPLLMLPSFTLWSSIASKEALLVFFVGIVCAHVVNMYKNVDRVSFTFVACFVLMLAYKPHYAPATILIVGVTYVSRYVSQKATIAVAAVGLSLVCLYMFRDKLDELSLYVDAALTSMGGRSGRELYLREQYDVFVKAPLGMYLNFTGPTFAEAGRGLLPMLTFIESLVIVVVLMTGFIVRLPRLPIYNLVLSVSAVFWIVFATYPPAVSNPGTAIRYRTGYLLIVILCLVILPSRRLYVDWVRNWQGPNRFISMLRGGRTPKTRAPQAAPPQ